MEIPADKPLEKELLPLFTTKAPFQLPPEWKEFIVKFSPYIMLILVPLALLVIGFGTIASLFSLITLNPIASLSMVITIVGLVFGLLAISGLFNRQRSGWVFSYYAYLMHILADVVNFHIVGAIITFLISGFFLFQIGEYYKN